MRRGLMMFCIVVCRGGPVCAGAWPQPAGETLLIAKYEREAGHFALLPGRTYADGPRSRIETLSVYGERGLSDTTTLVADVTLVNGDDGFSRYNGVGPASIGLRQVLARRWGVVVSAYAGGATAGAADQRDFGRARWTKGDLEARVETGWSGRIRGTDLFVELDAGRMLRNGLGDETRYSFSSSASVQWGFSVLYQVYAGEADKDSSQPFFQARWLKSDLTLLHRLGPWTLQGGWRKTLSGRNIPFATGPVFAVWRRF